MKQTDFEQLHQGKWQAFAENVQALRKGQPQLQAVQHFAQDYRGICQHLALAKTLALKYNVYAFNISIIQLPE